MIRTRTVAAVALAAVLGAGTALAQTTGSGISSDTPATTPGSTMGSGATGTTGRDLNPGHSASSATPAGPTIGANTPGARNDTPSGRNPVLTDQSAVRASKLIGSSVYNDKGEQIGSIDDILMGQDNKAQTAVLSVGGFLGIGAKLVEVPYEQLQFGDTRGSSENRVKLPNATKDSLQSMPEYQYRGSHG